MSKRINFDSLNYSPPALKNSCQLNEQQAPETEFHPLPPLPDLSPSHPITIYHTTRFEPAQKRNLFSDFEQGLADFFADIEDAFNTIERNVSEAIEEIEDSVTELLEDIGKFFRFD